MNVEPGQILVGTPRTPSANPAQADFDLGIVLRRTVGDNHKFDLLWSRFDKPMVERKMHEGVQFPNALLQSRCQKAGDPVDLTALLDIEYESIVAAVQQCRGCAHFEAANLIELLEAAGSELSKDTKRRSALRTRADAASTTCRGRKTITEEERQADRRAAKQWATIGDGLEVRPSGIPGAGNGLFATQDFASGPITMYDGDRLQDGKEGACKLAVQTHVGTKGEQQAAAHAAKQAASTAKQAQPSKQAGHSSLTHTSLPPSASDQVRSTLTATLLPSCMRRTRGAPKGS